MDACLFRGLSARWTALGGLVLAAVGCAPAAAQSGPAPAAAVSHSSELQVTDPERPFIEVTGTAEVSVPTDRARISFAVETEHAQADGAARDNAERMSAVIDALRAGTAPGLDVETFGYQLEPRYTGRQGDSEPRIAGYRARNHVRVTVDDIDAVGTLIDAATGAGANRIAGLSFEATDPEPARLQAVQDAVRKARSEAEAMAEALGVQLGGVLEVRGGAQVPGPIFRGLARAEMAQVATPTPIEGGSQTVRAQVTVRFAVGG